MPMNWPRKVYGCSSVGGMGVGARMENLSEGHGRDGEVVMKVRAGSTEVRYCREFVDLRTHCLLC